MNQLSVNLQHSIATLAAKGWLSRKIARELNVDRERVRRYRPVPDSKPAIPPTGSVESAAGYVAVIEAGAHFPQQKTLQKLAKAFNVDVAELLA